MIQFNELYITEDGKNLVIDVSIEDLPVYNNFYISDISLTLLDKCDEAKPTTVVYTGGTGLTYVDMDGSGYIDYKDKQLIDWMFSILRKFKPTGTQLSKYDVNHDGFIDLLDIQEINDYLLGLIPVKPEYDFVSPSTTGNPEVGIAEMNAIIQAILDIAKQSGLDNDTLEKFKSTMSRYKDLISSNAERQVSDPMKRRVRLCLPSIEKPLDFIDDAMSNHLFLVTVTADSFGDTSSLASMGCGWDEKVIRGLAYDDKMLYETAVSHASSYGDSCDNNDASSFVDFILRYYAFIFAIRCGDIDKACYYWNTYLKNGGKQQMHAGGGCGCHGPHR
jgi:hypothetical protein